MKALNILLVVFCFCYSGLNGMRTDDPSSQGLFRSMNRQIMHRIVCVTNEYPLPLLDDDTMLDKLCTDVLYRIPLTNKFSDWEHSLQYSDPLADYRQRYPDIHFHVSLPDSFLMTTSSTEMARLVAYLVKMQASSLDVIISRDTDLGVLYHVLLSYKDILPPGKQLSISIGESRDPTDLVMLGIIDTVNRVYAFPSHLKETPAQLSIFQKSPVTLSIRDYVRNLIDIGIPSYKLVIGVPSIIISVDNPLLDTSTIPSTYTSLCNSVTFSEWVPRRSLIREDGYDWENPHEKWKLRTKMGLSITNDVDHLNRMKIYGIGIFDLAFKPPVNPICSWHKDNFVQSVYQAINPQFSYLQHLSATEENLALSPRWRVIGGRLGKLLVFAQQQDEESYVNYFNITDDNTLMASPLDHVVLGYNEDGHVFSIYKSICQPSHAKLDDNNNLIDSLNYLVDRYSLETIIRHATVYGSLLPPSVLIFPEPLPINSPNGSLGAVAHPQIIPKLITWFKIRKSYQERQGQQNYRKKRTPERSYNLPNRPYGMADQANGAPKRPRPEYHHGIRERSFSMMDRPYGFPEGIEELHDRIRPYGCHNFHAPERLGTYLVSPRATDYPDPVMANYTDPPTETLEHPPSFLESSYYEDSTDPELTHALYPDGSFQFDSMFEMLSSLSVTNETHGESSSHSENDSSEYSNSNELPSSETIPDNQDVTTQRPDVSQENISSVPVTVGPRRLTTTFPNWQMATSKPYAFNIDAVKTAFDEAYNKIRNTLAKLG